jgi:hypothetical protein
MRVGNQSQRVIWVYSDNKRRYAPIRNRLLAFAMVNVLMLSACTHADSGMTKISGTSQILPPTFNLPIFTSIYDGTYAGTFNYEYQTVSRDEDKDLPGCEIISSWIPATIHITLTFVTVSLSPDPNFVELKITDVNCDDPAFGNVENCIISDEGLALNAHALFPVQPERTLLPEEGIILVIDFPNGSYLRTNQKVPNRGIFSASRDGSILSYKYDFTGFESYGIGAFFGHTDSGPFSPLKDYPDCFVRTISWTLVKISSQ